MREPPSALDTVRANEVLRVMKDLARKGQTMIVVTHSARFARNVADQVHVFAGAFEAPQDATKKSFLREFGGRVAT